LVTAGPNTADSFSNDSTVGTIDWSNPSNAETSNNVYATCVLPNYYDISHYLKALDFDFAIPSDSIILGILLQVECHASVDDGTLLWYMVKLVKGGVIGGANKALGMPALKDTGADWTYNFGGATDLWDQTWTPADINGADFGAVISVNNQASASRTAYVDCIIITVYYEHLVAVTESGIGTDTIQSVTATIPISETAAAVETILSPIPVLALDDGLGTEFVEAANAISVSDEGIGTEVPTIGIPIQDEGHLSIETVSLAAEIPVEEEAIGVDVVQRLQDTLTLDGAAFPHVLSVEIVEPSAVAQLLQTGTPDLPIRSQTGKYGRGVVVTGWVALADVEALKALSDGQDHLLMLPTGDSFYCHVNPVTVKMRPGNLSRIPYSIQLLERIDL